MREQVAHGAWILTHILRSAWEQRRDWDLATALAGEVRQLQAELHHTQQILSGYSSVLSTCERRNSSQARVNETFIAFFVLLLVAIGWLWCQRKGQPKVFVRPITGDTGGSSDSDSGADPRLKHKVVASGPVRPSHLGKGRKDGGRS